MKANIESLQDTFRYGYEQAEPSRIEAQRVWDYYHNRQYTHEQYAKLASRGQPAETFNVIKLFARMLMGYLSSVVNTVTILPVQESDTDTALLLNDIVQSIFDPTKFKTESDKVKLSAIVAGLMVVYEEVVDTGRTDEYGRPIREIKYSHVPDSEITLDPSSSLSDYSDANWMHRHKWIHEDLVVKTFGQEAKDKLDAYFNHLEQTDTEFEAKFNGEFVGKYKVWDNYLIVHSVMVDDDDKRWSMFWSGDILLEKKEITSGNVKFPYRVHKLHTSDLPEYYGIFREVLETQKAINQALIKYQLLANSQKVFVATGSVDNLEDFTDAFNRVTGVIPVTELGGIRVENLSREALQQYDIIDKGFNRIQRVLSINDSFLGLAFASDSGTKVKLQQNASITALRYITGQIEQFYALLGQDTVMLAQQYYTASQAIRIADEDVGIRWAEINKPLQIWTGEFDPETGEPIMQTQFEEVLDPDTGEPLVTDEGQRVVAPIPERGTEIAFTDIDITVSSVAFDDTEEKDRLMLETLLSGNVGAQLAGVNPAGYFQAASLAVKTLKTRHSADVSRILTDTAELIQQSQQAQQQVVNQANGGPDVSSQQPGGQQ